MIIFIIGFQYKGFSLNKIQKIKYKQNSNILNDMEKKGVIIIEGGCFYQMYANIIRKKMGWNNLISNSAKLVNILKGYGYKTSLRTTNQAVEAAIAGKLL